MKHPDLPRISESEIHIKILDQSESGDYIFGLLERDLTTADGEVVEKGAPVRVERKGEDDAGNAIWTVSPLVDETLH